MGYPVRVASMDAVRAVSTIGPVRIRFPGSNKTTLLDAFTASAMVAVYEVISAENKAKMERMVSASWPQFLRMATFALKQCKGGVS